jgi:hypothetical protein
VRRIAPLALLIPLVVGGCGGGSKEPTTHEVVVDDAGPPISKAGFLEQADAICRNHQSRREDLESQAGELGPLASRKQARRVAALLRKEADNRRAEVGEVRALQPPSPDAATVNSILSLVGAEATVIDRWATAYDDLDNERIRRLQIRLGVTAGRASGRARAYGFQVCGQE